MRARSLSLWIGGFILLVVAIVAYDSYVVARIYKANASKKPPASIAPQSQPDEPKGPQRIE